MRRCLHGHVVLSGGSCWGVTLYWRGNSNQSVCVANIVCSGAKVTSGKDKPSDWVSDTLATSKSWRVEEFWFTCIRKLKRKNQAGRLKNKPNPLKRWLKISNYPRKTWTSMSPIVSIFAEAIRQRGVSHRAILQQATCSCHVKDAAAFFSLNRTSPKEFNWSPGRFHQKSPWQLWSGELTVSVSIHLPLNCGAA